MSRRLAVVICSRDRADLLAAALPAAAAAVPKDTDLLVVDSASSTPATAEVATKAGWRLVRAERPGLSIARNVGLRATTAEVVAFTDDDCAPQPGWGEVILDAFEDAGIGLATGPLAAGEGGIQMTVDLGDLPLNFDATTDPAKLGTGACMAFRRSALVGAGGFDEALGAGSSLRSGEDHDAMWRVLRAGWRGVYRPDAVVVHREWRTKLDMVLLNWASGLGAGAMIGKIIKVDPHTGWKLLNRRVVHDGLGGSVRAAAKGWDGPAAAWLLYAAGNLAGAARVARRPLTRGVLSADR